VYPNANRVFLMISGVGDLSIKNILRTMFVSLKITPYYYFESVELVQYFSKNKPDQHFLE